MKHRVLLLLLFLLPLLPILRGQTLEAAHEQADAPKYVLGPDDQLSIHVVDFEDASDKPVRIDPSGFIDLPLAGRIQVAGLSVEQLRTAIAEKLAKYIDSPKITINVLEYRSQPVSILGQVNSPGVHQLQGPKRLLEIISLAGGVKPDAGDKLTITRESKWGVLPVPGARMDMSGRFSVADIPLATLTAGHDPAANIAVYPNDVISVSRAAVVYVIGEVKKAGGFSLESRSDISLLRALALAEGMTHEASPKKAKILRAADEPQSRPQETPVDVDKILAGKAPDVLLRANDILFIPNSVSNSAMKRAVEAAVQIATGVVIFRP